MLKFKFHILAVLLMVSLSACGIFKKGCDCPHVSKTATANTGNQNS